MSTIDSNSMDLWGVGAPMNVGALYEESKNDLGIDDFLQLMIAEITNMDFMAGGESSSSSSTSDYVTQLAQITTMQQMEQLAYYSKTNYVMSLIGKEVTVADYTIGGNVKSDTGIVEKISLSGEEPMVYINGVGYPTSKIMTINSETVVAEEELADVVDLSPYLMKRGATSVTVGWEFPEVENPDDYLVDVYYSEKPDFDSVEQVREHGTLAAHLTGSDFRNVDIEDLYPETTYYVNIVISTDSGVEKTYQKLKFETKESD